MHTRSSVPQTTDRSQRPLRPEGCGSKTLRPLRCPWSRTDCAAIVRTSRDSFASVCSSAPCSVGTRASVPNPDLSMNSAWLTQPCSSSCPVSSVPQPRQPRRLPNRKAVIAAVASPPTAELPSSSSSPATTAPPPVPFLDPREAMRDASGRLLLKNLTLPELTQWCESVGEVSPHKRAQQMFRWMYGKGRWIRSLEEADSQSQAFSNAFKAKVQQGGSLSGGVTLQSVMKDRDGTCKLVFALNQDEGGASGSVETVLIPMPHKAGGMRYTACLSTQVGCAMNCQFCLTGRMGLMGNLTTAQIVEQVVEARRWLSEQAPPGGNVPPIGNIVFMGMGEPLHNYHPVLAAIDILAEGLALSRNKIIVSSVGLVNPIRSFLATGKAKLALSLHATTDEVRDWIVPTNRRHPIAELMTMLQEHFPLYEGANRSPARGDKFVIIEYVMLKGINDSVEDAKRLADLLSEIYCMVNLIVFNPHEGTQFQRSDPESVSAFRYTLARAGKVCTVRESKGEDSMAACGQLGDPGSSPRPAPILTPPARLMAALEGQSA